MLESTGILVLDIMNLIKNKKAQAHVELMVSFVIFIGFILALFIFINPIKEKNAFPPDINDLQEKIMANVSIVFKSLALVTDTLEQTPSCFYVNDTVTDSINFIVRNINNSLLNYSRTLNTLNIAKDSNRVYKIYISEKFNYIPTNFTLCQQLSSNNYSFGPMAYERAVLYENLVNLNSLYASDYNLLKKQLKIEDDFSFIVYDENRNILMNESASNVKFTGINIISRDIPLKVINKNAASFNIIINIRLW